MKWTKDAIKLIKRFSEGVDCPNWREESIETTMFHPYCKDIAGKVGKKEIDIDSVRGYILKIHNLITVQVGKIGKESAEAIENCMVRPKEKENGWVCVHGTAEVMSISRDEAENLEQGNQKLLKSL